MEKCYLCGFVVLFYMLVFCLFMEFVGNFVCVCSVCCSFMVGVQ